MRLKRPATPANQAHLGLVFLVLAASAATYSLFQSVLVPALPAIRDELHATPQAATWLITGYLVSASVATPIAGNLGDLFGTRRVLVVVLALCAFGTVLAATANSIQQLIAARVIQGLAGAVFPLSFGIIRDVFPARWVPTGIAMISSLLGVGGVVGITLAGPIIDALGYHWLFWLPLAVVVTAAIGAALFIPDSEPVPDSERGNTVRPDWIGAGLMAAWLIAVLVAISQGEAWGWGSARQIVLFGLGVALFAVWVRAEQHSSHPMIDMSLMSRRPIWTANAAGLLYGYCLFTSIVLVPQFAETPREAGYGFGASVTSAGLYLLPSTATMVLMGPVTGWISTRYGPRLALILGTLVSALAFLGLAFAHATSWHLYVTSALLGAGNGLCYGSLPNLIVNAVPRARTGTATGINVVFRNVGGALGSQVATSIVAASATLHANPTERAFTVAFLLGAAAPLVALFLTVLMPGDRVVMDLHPLPETAAKV